MSPLTGELLPVMKAPGDVVTRVRHANKEKSRQSLLPLGHRFFGKAAHLVDSANQVGHFQKVLTMIRTFASARLRCEGLWHIVPESTIFLCFSLEGLRLRCLLPFLLRWPLVLIVSKKKGAITKKMTTIEEMADKDVFCSDKTGTLTLNKLTVYKNLIERTTLTYIDGEGKRHMVSQSKCALEQIINLAHNKADIDKFAGLRSLAVAYQETFAENTTRMAFKRLLFSGVAYALRILISEREEFERQNGWTIRTMEKEPLPVRDEYALVIVSQVTISYIESLDMMSCEDREKILRARATSKAVLMSSVQVA